MVGDHKLKCTANGRLLQLSEHKNNVTIVRLWGD
jgi:hypothetical protein